MKYPLLSDPTSEMIRTFGILNENYKQGHKWHGVPYPYIFLVSPDGKIVARLSDERYQDRPPVDSILTLIEKTHPEPGPATPKGAPGG